MTRPRRNDPCPCGSGLKYKKCCMPQPERPHQPPDEPQRIFAQAVKKLSELQWEQALELFKSLDSSGETPCEVLEGMAACYDGLDDYLRSAQLYEKALAVCPASRRSSVCYRLGVSRGCAGRIDKAMDAFRECLEQTPGEDAKHQLRRTIGILEEIQRGDRDPSFFTVQVQVQRAFTEMEADRHESAQARFTKALELDPENPVIFYNLGVVNTFLGRHDEAVEKFQNAVDRDPRYAEAWYNMGQICLIKKRDFSKALHCFQQAAAARPDYVGAHHQQGIAWELLGDARRAIQCWERTLDLDPENQPAKESLERVKAGQSPLQQILNP